jgi:hypothetical protein
MAVNWRIIYWSPSFFPIDSQRTAQLLTLTFAPMVEAKGEFQRLSNLWFTKIATSFVSVANVLLWKRSWDSEEGYCLHLWSLEPCYPILMSHISHLKLWGLVNPMKFKLLWHMTSFSCNSHQIIWSWFGHNLISKLCCEWSRILFLTFQTFITIGVQQLLLYLMLKIILNNLRWPFP